EDLDPMAARFELVDRVEQMGEVLPFSDIHAQGHAADRLPRPGGEIGEGRDERRGQIVDAEKAHVLETLDRVALAGTAEPGDEDEGQALVHGADARTRRLPHRLRGWSLRWCEGTMPSSSRYFATDWVTLRRVRCRWSTDLISQRAERSFCSTYWRASSPELRSSER